MSEINETLQDDISPWSYLLRKMNSVRNAPAPLPTDEEIKEVADLLPQPCVGEDYTQWLLRFQKERKQGRWPKPNSVYKLITSCQRKAAFSGNTLPEGIIEFPHGDIRMEITKVDEELKLTIDATYNYAEKDIFIFGDKEFKYLLANIKLDYEANGSTCIPDTDEVRKYLWTIVVAEKKLA